MGNRNRPARRCGVGPVGRICNPSGRFEKPSYNTRYTTPKSALRGDGRGNDLGGLRRAAQEAAADRLQPLPARQAVRPKLLRPPLLLAVEQGPVQAELAG